MKQRHLEERCSAGLLFLALSVAACDEASQRPAPASTAVTLSAKQSPKSTGAASALPSSTAPKPQAPQSPPWATRLTKDSGIPCSVEKVLASSCRRCHWAPPENDAPFGMVRWEELQQKREGKPTFKLMEQMIEADLMPPLDAMVKPPVTPLTGEQKKTLLDWLKSGALRSNEPCPE